MLTKEEIEKLAKAKYPEKWEHYYGEYQWNDGWHDENETARNAFKEGLYTALTLGNKYGN